MKRDKVKEVLELLKELDEEAIEKVYEIIIKDY